MGSPGAVGSPVLGSPQCYGTPWCFQEPSVVGSSVLGDPRCCGTPHSRGSAGPWALREQLWWGSGTWAEQTEQTLVRISNKQSVETETEEMQSYPHNQFWFSSSWIHCVSLWHVNGWLSFTCFIPKF